MDIASIPVDLLRRDYLSALFDVVGIIPFAGEIGDTAKFARIGDNAYDTGKAFNKQTRGTPRNNKAQNKQTDSIGKKLKLSPKQQRELHDLIHGQNWGYREILEFAKEWFNK